MSDTRMEVVFWSLALAVYGLGVVAPRALVRIVGWGRVTPGLGMLRALRVLGAVCLVGAAWRLATLGRR